MTDIKAGAGAAAAKIAASNKASDNENIQVGASVGGTKINNPQKPAGIQETKRAPGYYSRHCGLIRLGRRKIEWPMEAPLVPEKDDKELISYLESLVERGLAHQVK